MPAAKGQNHGTLCSRRFFGAGRALIFSAFSVFMVSFAFSAVLILFFLLLAAEQWSSSRRTKPVLALLRLRRTSDAIKRISARSSSSDCSKPGNECLPPRAIECVTLVIIATSLQTQWSDCVEI